MNTLIRYGFQAPGVVSGSSIVLKGELDEASKALLASAFAPLPEGARECGGMHGAFGFIPRDIGLRSPSDPSPSQTNKFGGLFEVLEVGRTSLPPTPKQKPGQMMPDGVWEADAFVVACLKNSLNWKARTLEVEEPFEMQGGKPKEPEMEPS